MASASSTAASTGSRSVTDWLIIASPSLMTATLPAVHRSGCQQIDGSTVTEATKGGSFGPGLPGLAPFVLVGFAAAHRVGPGRATAVADGEEVVAGRPLPVAGGG